MSFGIFEIFQHMGVAAMIVAAVLVVMGLASLTVFIERIIALRRSRAASRSFAAAVAEPMQRGDIDAILSASEGRTAGHLARVVRSGLTTYWHATKTADISGLTPAERTRRHLERYMEEIGADLRRGLAVLASVGSVAPFVGLLGTVVGIITRVPGHRGDRIGRPLVGVGGHQRGARRDGAGSRGRDPRGARLSLPHQSDRARRGSVESFGGRAPRHDRGLGGARRAVGGAPRARRVSA